MQYTDLTIRIYPHHVRCANGTDKKISKSRKGVTAFDYTTTTTTKKDRFLFSPIFYYFFGELTINRSGLPRLKFIQLKNVFTIWFSAFIWKFCIISVVFRSFKYLKFIYSTSVNGYTVCKRNSKRK